MTAREINSVLESDMRKVALFGNMILLVFNNPTNKIANLIKEIRSKRPEITIEQDFSENVLLFLNFSDGSFGIRVGPEILEAMVQNNYRLEIWGGLELPKETFSPNWPIQVLDWSTEFKTAPINSPSSEGTIALFIALNGKFHPSGTGVLIAPNLALTARHVIQDFQDQVSVNPDSNNGQLMDVWAVQVIVQGNKNVFSIWHSKHIAYSQSTDIAIMALKPINENANKHTYHDVKTVNLIPPIPGTRVNAFGYIVAPDLANIDSIASLTFIENVGDKIRIGAASTGNVVELHNRYRDSVMLPFPTFRTNAKFQGGMSGGPVLNQAGNLIGLVCAGMDQADQGEGNISYAAILWPILGLKIRYKIHENSDEEEYTFFDLIQKGVVRASGLDRFELDDNDSVIYKYRSGPGNPVVFSTTPD